MDSAFPECGEGTDIGEHDEDDFGGQGVARFQAAIYGFVEFPVVLLDDYIGFDELL